MSGAVSQIASLGVARVTLVGGSIQAFNLDPGDAIATLSIESDGDEIHATGVVTDVGDWISPKGLAGANYEIRATLTSGTVGGEAVDGTWLSLGTTRNWQNAQTSVGTTTGEIDVDIRRASDGAILASAHYLIEATVEV